MAGNSDDIDIELLIGEVKKYPEIWNVAAETYHDRNKKKGAWIKISEVFCEGFNEKNDKEKNEICMKYVNKWKNIKDNYNKSEKKKSKSGQAADSGRSYIYARQLSFLKKASATIETHSSLDNDELGEDLEQSEENNVTQSDRSESCPVYNQKSTRKRKLDIESTLIDFMNSPIPASTVPAFVPEPNPDRSFFESIIPSIKDFTEDQKLEFRSEVLNIIKRMRNPLYTSHLNTQNYEYPPNVSYHRPSHVSVPMYQSSNYSTHPQLYKSPATQRTRPTISFSQPLNPSPNFNPISPSSTSSTTIDPQTYTRENSLDIFSDGTPTNFV